MTQTRRRPFLRLFALLLLAQAVLAAEGDGFVPLFNGQDLTGWDGDPRFWRVQDGALLGETTAENPTKANTFCIWRGGEPADFELALSFRIVGGNSGIQFRSKDLGGRLVSGYQANLAAGSEWTGGVLYEEKGRAVLARRGQRTVLGADGKVAVTGTLGDDRDLAAAIRLEQWNEYRVTAIGNRISLWINGAPMCETTDDHPQKRALQGILALQLHAGPPMQVWFKDIRLKALKAE